MPPAVLVDALRIEEWVAACLRTVGVRDEAAIVTARVMTRATLRGNDHGVHLLPAFLRRIEGGAINPSAHPRIVRDGVATALIDGDAGLGPYVAYNAMAHAIDKAKKVGCSSIAVRNSSHLAAPGVYVLKCAEDGLIGLIYTHGPASIRVTGGRGPALSSGPRAFGVPSRRFPIVLDIAMAPAGTKIMSAAERGEKIPLGWLEDANGRATTDPAAYLQGGARVPIGEHKGYGLALIGELLTAGLSGANFAWAMGSFPWSESVPWNVGHAIIVIDPRAYMPLTDFLDRVDAVVDWIKKSPTGPKSRGILIPGERAAEAERTHMESGVPLKVEDWRILTDTASRIGTLRLLDEARR